MSSGIVNVNYFAIFALNDRVIELKVDINDCIWQQLGYSTLAFRSRKEITLRLIINYFTKEKIGFKYEDQYESVGA